MRKSLGMDVLVEGDRDLLNVYHVIVVNPAKWPKVNAEGANAFAGFLVAADTQKAIGTFGVGKFGAPLFFPDAGKKVEELGR
jgi:tungstate transport system substrate-binding protein